MSKFGFQKGGGFVPFPKGNHLGVEFKKGGHPSPKTEFKKGHKKSNTGRTWIRKGQRIGVKTEFQKGQKIRFGKKQSEIAKRKLREWNINHPNRKFVDTSIELKIENELKKRKINYQKQVPLCKIARVDFLLEDKIVIFADGDYWHNLSKQKDKDKRQNEILISNGYKIYRFWEHEINENVKDCVDKIMVL